jgi:hypothetical protein
MTIQQKINLEMLKVEYLGKVFDIFDNYMSNPSENQAENMSFESKLDFDFEKDELNYE